MIFSRAEEQGPASTDYVILCDTKTPPAKAREMSPVQEFSVRSPPYLGARTDPIRSG
jgi:hypothetical protein